MEVNQALPLLAGLSPAQFMRRYWQKKPLLIRQAMPAFVAPVERSGLFALAAQDQVESRLVIGASGADEGGWRLRHGPFMRRALPALKQAGWSLLVQGVDLHVDAVHALLNRFRFVPDARLDDVMVSYATDGGGVGPHFDSYDVFLLQTHGRRRWRIGRQQDMSLQAGVPLKILSNFQPEMEFDLDPGDMLYLPPRYAHDGIALGECMTYSFGFKVPSRGDLAGELLQRLAQDAPHIAGDLLYRDAAQPAVDAPALIPQALQAFAQQALQQVLRDPLALARSLGESLSEPKPRVWFDAARDGKIDGPIRLDRRTKMLYDQNHLFINGESYRASGRDAALMRRLADDRALDQRAQAHASAQARELLHAWCSAGWAHGD